MKRYEIIDPHRKPKMTRAGWSILICSAMLGGVIAGEAITRVLPNVPWDTRGGSFTRTMQHAPSQHAR